MLVRLWQVQSALCAAVVTETLNGSCHFLFVKFRATPNILHHLTTLIPTLTDEYVWIALFLEQIKLDLFQSISKLGRKVTQKKM